MIIVTGAMGFVGRNLVAQLLRSGNPVRVLIPAPIVARYQRHNRPWPWADAGEAEIVEGSIFQGESLFQAMQGVHTVFHLASAQWWGSRSDLEQIDLLGWSYHCIESSERRTFLRLLLTPRKRAKGGTHTFRWCGLYHLSLWGDFWASRSFCQ